MCSEEPCGVYRYGSVPAIEALENGAEYRYYQELLATPHGHLPRGRNLDLVANEIARLEFPGTARRSWNRLCCGKQRRNAGT